MIKSPLLKKIGMAVLIANALSACSTLILLEPGAPHAIDNTYEIEIGRTWSYQKATSAHPVNFMTIDGGRLNHFDLATSLKDGEAIVYQRSKEKILPVFRSSMSEGEIVEFVSDTQRYIGGQNVEVTRIEPAKFGSLDGVEFDLKLDTQNGLNILSTGKAAINGDTLYLLFFSAPAEYYYQREAGEIRRIFDSVRLLRKKTNS